MPDTNGKLLPPLDKEAFDGESEKIELKFPKHSHQPTFIGNSTIKCDCGAGWSGPQIEKLLKAFS